MPHPHLPVLRDLVTGIPGVVAAIQVSPEGLVVGTSPGIDTDEAERLAAAMAALGAMSSESIGAVGRLTAGEHPWGHSIIEDSFGQTLTLVGASDRSMLAVVGTKGADLAEIVAQMIALADQSLTAAVAV